MSTNTCVCCGAIIPEGRQVCPICERTETIEPFKPKNKTEKEPNKMKDYYETKKKRYTYILEALDEKISNSMRTIGILPLKMAQDRINELVETRELITSEIEYIDDALNKLKADEAVKAAEQAAETEAE